MQKISIVCLVSGVLMSFSAKADLSVFQEGAATAVGRFFGGHSRGSQAGPERTRDSSEQLEQIRPRLEAMNNKDLMVFVQHTYLFKVSRGRTYGGYYEQLMHDEQFRHENARLESVPATHDPEFARLIYEISRDATWGNDNAVRWGLDAFKSQVIEILASRRIQLMNDPELRAVYFELIANAIETTPELVGEGTATNFAKQMLPEAKDLTWESFVEIFRLVSLDNPGDRPAGLYNYFSALELTDPRQIELREVLSETRGFWAYTSKVELRRTNFPSNETERQLAERVIRYFESRELRIENRKNIAGYLAAGFVNNLSENTELLERLVRNAGANQTETRSALGPIAQAIFLGVPSAELPRWEASLRAAGLQDRDVAFYFLENLTARIRGQIGHIQQAQTPNERLIAARKAQQFLFKSLQLLERYYHSENLRHYHPIISTLIETFPRELNSTVEGSELARKYGTFERRTRVQLGDRVRELIGRPRAPSVRSCLSVFAN